MEKKPPHHFHVRLPESLFTDIANEMRRKGGKSLNKEIVERLRETTQKDDAKQIVDALRPLMEGLDDDEREHFARLAVEAITVLSKAKKKRPPKK